MKILVTNQKGGVGKSTISANLAHYFSNVTRGRTTLVDYDTQASSSKWVRSIKPQKITVFKANLPLSESSNRILIESRRIIQGISERSEVLIADLTWFDIFDSEMFLDFDLVVLPTAISEVELIATMEFAARHEWVFQGPRSPSLVIVPSRVRGDQALKFKHNTERFPFGFFLTPPIIDSVEAKKSFGKKFLLNLKNHKLSSSFRTFCEAIQQTGSIHYEKLKKKAQSGNDHRSKLSSVLSYYVKKSHAQRSIDKKKSLTQNLEEQENPSSTDTLFTGREGVNSSVKHGNKITGEVLAEPYLDHGNSRTINSRKKTTSASNGGFKENNELQKKEPRPIESITRRVLEVPPKFLRKQSSGS